MVEASISFGMHYAPMVTFSSILGFSKMLILIVGEMLAILPSLKEFGAGMGFRNQSTSPWMNSFDSTIYWS